MHKNKSKGFLDTVCLSVYMSVYLHVQNRNRIFEKIDDIGSLLITIKEALNIHARKGSLTRQVGQELPLVRQSAEEYCG